MTVPLLVVAEDLGLLPDARRWLDQAVAQLQRRRDQLVGPASPAAALARRIGRTIPIVYGAAGIGSVAAWRWKADVNGKIDPTKQIDPASHISIPASPCSP